MILVIDCGSIIGQLINVQNYEQVQELLHTYLYGWVIMVSFEVLFVAVFTTEDFSTLFTHLTVVLKYECTNATQKQLQFIIKSCLLYLISC